MTFFLVISRLRVSLIRYVASESILPSTIRLWNLRGKIYISFSIFIIKMYIYVYFHRSATWNTYCYDAHSSPHSPLPIPSITSRICRKWQVRELVHSYVGKYVVCNMRATSGAYFFLRFLHPPYIHPLCSIVDVFFTLEIPRFGGRLLYKKITKGKDLFSLSTVAKNRCKRCRGLKLFYVIFFPFFFGYRKLECWSISLSLMFLFRLFDQLSVSFVLSFSFLLFNISFTRFISVF